MDGGSVYAGAGAAPFSRRGGSVAVGARVVVPQFATGRTAVQLVSRDASARAGGEYSEG